MLRISVRMRDIHPAANRLYPRRHGQPSTRGPRRGFEPKVVPVHHSKLEPWREVVAGRQRQAAGDQTAACIFATLPAT